VVPDGQWISMSAVGTVPSPKCMAGIVGGKIAELAGHARLSSSRVGTQSAA
jgi:hypothetical protein